MTLPHLLLLLRLGAADPAADLAPEADASKPVLDAATCAQRPTDCVAAAGAEFDAHNFAAAVRLFEALVAAYPDTPKYHYFAGLARESAGDDTAAYLHMRHFLASNTDNVTERKRAMRRTTTILARNTKLSLRTPTSTTPLTLRLTPTGPANLNAPTLVIPLAALTMTDGAHELALTPGQWELALDPARLGDMEAMPRRIEVFDGVRAITAEISTRPVRHQLTLELGPPRALKRGVTLDLHRINGPTLSLTTKVPAVHRELPPGTWVYEVEARGFLPQTQTLVLNGPQSLTLELAPKWSEDRHKRLKLGVGLAGAGLATGIAGAALLAYADKRLKNPDPAPPRHSDEPAQIIAAAGSALLGTTLGMWIGGASSTSRSRRVWFTEAAIGAIGATTAAIWYDRRTRAAPLEFAFMSPEKPAALRDLDARLLTAAGLLGFGVGLLSASIVKLVSNRTSHKTSRFSRKRFSFTPGSHPAHINF